MTTPNTRTLLALIALLSFAPLATATADFHETATPPSFNVAATVPASVEYRMIFGAVIHPSGLSQSEFYAAIKGPGGAGTIVVHDQPAASSAASPIVPFYVLIPGGTTYYLNQSGGVTWDSYSFVDVYPDCASLPCESGTHANNTFEGQAHANATWCQKGTDPDNACVGNRYANATLETSAHASNTYCQRSNDADLGCAGNRWANATLSGQVFDNATYCKLPSCGIDGSTFVTNAWANSTTGVCRKGTDADAACVGNRFFNASSGQTGTFPGTLTAPHFHGGDATLTGLTVGPVTASDLTVQGSMTTTTAWDPYVSMLIFAGLTLATVLSGAWGLQQKAIAAKVALVLLFVIAAVWSADQAVATDANVFRWAAVVTLSAFALLLAATAKPTRRA